MRRLGASLLILVFAAGCGSNERVVLAAGTTLVDSGFIAHVLEDYPGEVSVVGVSSLEALALGSSGSADVLITHLPEAEADFLIDHPGAVQEPIFASHFVIVGPASWRPVVDDPVELLRSIAAQRRSFVSRADGSGTAAKERQLWDIAGIDPDGAPWYTETGQGMGFTLQVANQRNAITLAEIGSFARAESITLVPLASDDDRLFNPYLMTRVDTPGLAASELFDWLTSAEGRQAIIDANADLFGEVLYAPSPLGPES